MLRILSPGVQTSLQGAPRRGWRHYGIPSSGPADALSMALANRLVGNPSEATTVEITLGGFVCEFERDCRFAITGAVGPAHLSGRALPVHETCIARRGDSLQIEPPRLGMRAYLAVPGGFEAERVFGSTSTYLMAGFGGYDGRALKAGDVLNVKDGSSHGQSFVTPEKLRPVFSNSVALRACSSAESELLPAQAEHKFYQHTYQAAQQITRMGFALEGPHLDLESDGMMKSAAVYPGTVQCPPSGQPYILACDAQTTGGYPRLAQIARCDLHLLGQIRPGDRIQFLHRSLADAAKAYKEKRALLQDWLTGFEL